MNYTEEAALFKCANNTLVGILARPEAPVHTGVVVVVGGPQYRAGSHRQFVLLSRTLAQTGYAVLRFDYRGMGDSQGDVQDFLTVSGDIASAIDTLQQRVPVVRQVALWGLCDGASAALLYCVESQDRRVSGLCLLNPWVRSEASLARTQVKHYYTRRLLQKEFWRKLLSGQVAPDALGGLLGNLKNAVSAPARGAPVGQPAFQTQMAKAWRHPRRPVLLMLSGHDLIAKEFLDYVATSPDWSGALTQPLLQRHNLPQADHTCASASWQQQIEVCTLGWLSQTQATYDTSDTQTASS